MRGQRFVVPAGLLIGYPQQRRRTPVLRGQGLGLSSWVYGIETLASRNVASGDFQHSFHVFGMRHEDPLGRFDGVIVLA